MRTLALAGAVAGLIVALTAHAYADETKHRGFTLMTGFIPAPREPLPAGGLGGQIIYVNRCIGGCVVHPGLDDASTDTSAAATMLGTVTEYTGFQTGEWEQIMQCFREVYSPFNVTITETRPPAGTIYEEQLVGGNPEEIGLPNTVGGYGTIQTGCVANPKGVSFTFTSAIDGFAQEDGGSRVFGLCWIMAQETAHNFGLFHEYSYLDDGRSACNDPMTYRSDCGGQKFYRNKIAKQGGFDACGTTEAEGPCYCGGQENSHQRMTELFGPGTSLVPPPSAVITLPAADGSLGASVIASIGSKRGVERAEVYLNGYKWKELPGVVFGAQGQANPSSYQFPLPADLPNSIYDIVVKGYDDLGLVGVSPTVTVTKGAACASADTCLKGQNCENGRCFWDPASGEIGDDCTFAQFCKSGICQGTAEQSICTQECIPGTADSCPADGGLECIESAPGKGICFFKPDDGGCCSVGASSNAWIPGGLGALVFGFLTLRPRSRR